MNNLPEQEQEQEQEQEEEQDRARCEWDFNLRTVVSSTTTQNAVVSDALGVIEFDPSDTVVATGGIARKIRVYSIKSLLPDDDDDDDDDDEGSSSDAVALLDNKKVCDYYICTPAKLSSMKWKTGTGGRVLGSGDYDGVVMEYDLEKKVPVFERDEHGGRRVWSVDYSKWDPVLGASGSDDGTMQMWDPRCEDGKCVSTVQPSGVSRSAVCCVEFHPLGGSSLVAVGCADRRAYAYDVRKMVEPIFIFDGHQKTVTYIKFLDVNTLVTAGTDGCLKTWNIVNNEPRVIRTYRGHVNNRSFVGLSVWREGGLVGCGSETDQVFVYDRRWGEPIWVHGVEPALFVGDGSEERRFVSSVCWGQMVGEDKCTLVAGGSDGVLQVFMGKKKH